MRDMVKLSPNVVFCGENPGITLYAEGEIVAAASYWRSVYSPVGEGSVLLLRLDAEGTVAIYSDNPALARYVTDEFTQHFGEYKGRGFTEAVPVAARFVQDSDSRRYHRVVCYAERTIELVWHEPLAYQLLIMPGFTGGRAGDKKYDVSSVICPTRSATITIDGQAVAGEVRHNPDEATFPTTAFLAFNEAWYESPQEGGDEQAGKD